jgi:hypothetical protein
MDERLIRSTSWNLASSLMGQVATERTVITMITVTTMRFEYHVCLTYRISCASPSIPHSIQTIFSGSLFSFICVDLGVLAPEPEPSSKGAPSGLSPSIGSKGLLSPAKNTPSIALASSSSARYYTRCQHAPSNSASIPNSPNTNEPPPQTTPLPQCSPANSAPSNVQYTAQHSTPAFPQKSPAANKTYSPPRDRNPASRTRTSATRSRRLC